MCYRYPITISIITVLAFICTSSAFATPARMSSYSSFHDALYGNLNVQNKTLYLDIPTKLDADEVVPANISIIMEYPGSIDQGTHTLIINGPFTAPLYAVFTGIGLIKFGTGTVKDVYPQWFGAKGDGTTDSTAAIQLAIDSVHASGGGQLHFPVGTYVISDQLLWRSRVAIIGESKEFTQIFQKSTDKPILRTAIMPGSGGGFSPNKGVGMHLKNIFLYFAPRKRAVYKVPDACGVLIEEAPVKSFLWEDVRIYNAYAGVAVRKGASFFGGQIRNLAVQNSYFGFLKEGSGYITSLEAKWLQFANNFHGIKANRVTYSSFSINHDSGGLISPAISYGPPDEMPINIDLGRATGVTIQSGNEQLNAIQIRVTQRSYVTLDSLTIITGPSFLWKQDASRTSNIALADQALFVLDSSRLEFSNLELIERTKDNYPSVTATVSNLFSFNNSGVLIKNSFIQTDSYYLSNIGSFPKIVGNETRLSNPYIMVQNSVALDAIQPGTTARRRFADTGQADTTK